MKYLIEGEKGGNNPPKEYRDTIQMTGEAHMIHLLCEGEIEGLVDQGGSGNENERKKKSIYIDEVPFTLGDFPNVQHDVSTHFRKGSFEDTNKFSDFTSELGGAKYAMNSIPISVPDSNRILYTRPITVSFNSKTYPGISSVSVNVKFPLMSHTVNEDEAEAKRRYANKDESDEQKMTVRFDNAIAQILGFTQSSSQLKSKFTPVYNLPGDVNNGDILPSIVEYGIFISHNQGPYKRVEIKQIKHKASSPFLDSTEISLPYDKSLNVNYWDVKVVRFSSDFTDTTIKVNNETYLDSIFGKTDVVEFVYPNSAMNAITFSAKEFPSIPKLGYQLRLLKVKVPKGYTPTKYYAYNSGNITNRKIVENEAKYPNVWSGNFTDEKVWTDNPAWIYYDLLTNKRYGLGDFVGEENIDKWSLYQISKYCDEMIPNNQNDFTGTKPTEGTSAWLDWAAAHEPRFTANFLLNESEDAYTVVNNLASVFRGMTYWLGGAIGLASDQEKDPSFLYTNSDVKEGMFHYSSSERSQRRTVALVRWNDPNNFWRPTLEKVEDTEGVLDFGIRENQLASFATTSQGQAHRAGKWSLLTEQLESSLVTFELGLNGAIPRPTDIIGIYDNFKTNRQFGGRVLDLSNALSDIYLDRLIDLDSNTNISYKITLNIPSGFKDPLYVGTDNDLLVTTSEDYSGSIPQFLYTYPITGFTNNSGKHIVHISGNLPKKYIGGTWSIESELNGNISGADLYRVLKVGETEEKTFEVTALEYKAEKYGLSQEGFKLSNNINPDFNSWPIGQPFNLSLSKFINFEDDNFNAYIQADFAGATGKYISHYIASGKNISKTGTFWKPFKIREKINQPGYQVGNFFPNSTGTYEISVQTVQLGGQVSAGITDTIDFTIDPPYSDVMEPEIQIVNQPENSIDTTTSGEYIGFDPELYFTYRLSGNLTLVEDDPRYKWMEGISLKFFDEFNNPISDEFLTTDQQSVIIEKDVFSVSGAENLRKIKAKASGVMFPDKKGTPVEKIIHNPPISQSEFKIVNANSLKVIYNIVPSEPLPKDFSGLYLWTGVGTFTPDLNNPDIVNRSLNGEVDVSGIQSSGINNNVYWGLVDYFSTSGTIINGPSSLLLEPLPAHTGWNANFFNYKKENSLGIETSVMQLRWYRHQSEDVIGYEIAISNNDNSFRTDAYVGNALDRSLMYYSFKAPVEEKTYSAFIRASSFDNRRTPWEGPFNAYAQKTKFNELTVFGESEFHKTTKVIVESGVVSNGDNYIDFSESNITVLDCNNTSLATIYPVSGTVREGATYLLQIKKNTSASLNWSNNNFKFNDGNVPDFNVNTSNIVSCVGLQNDILHSVANTNFI